MHLLRDYSQKIYILVISQEFSQADLSYDKVLYLSVLFSVSQRNTSYQYRLMTSCCEKSATEYLTTPKASII